MADETTNVQSINQGKPVYFSYALNSSEQPEWEHISDCVDTITDIFKEQHIEYQLNNDSLETGDVIVLVFSDRYFHSMRCMNEFVQIIKAINKNSKKRLFCIKAGNFDLTDPGYIRGLERYWGTKKLEYEEVEYHKERPLTDDEKTANKNGFYLNVVRNLYSFFATTNYARSTDKDWTGFVKDITDCYQKSNKSSFYVQLQRKSISGKLKAFVFGLCFVLCVIFAFRLIQNRYSKPRDIDFPLYSRNDFITQDQMTYITKVELREDCTHVFFRTVNLTNDEYKFVSRCTNPYLVVGTTNYYRFTLRDEYGPSMYQYFRGGRGTYVDYEMVFPNIGLESGYMNYMETDGRGIFDLDILRLNHYSVEHPISRNVAANFFVSKIEVDISETIIYGHFINDDTCDYNFTVHPDWHIVANNEKYNITNTAGIKMYPASLIIPKLSSADVALFFPEIPEETDSIDLVMGNVTINGLQLKRTPLITIENPKCELGIEGWSISKIEITKDATIIYMEVDNSHGPLGASYFVNSDSYINADGKVYQIEDASGILFYPQQTLIPRNTIFHYAVFFPPIPEGTETIDYYFKVICRSDYETEEEYRNIIETHSLIEEGDIAISGIFGIHLNNKDSLNAK